MAEPNGDGSVDEVAWWLIALLILIHDGPLIERLQLAETGDLNLPQNVIDQAVTLAKSFQGLSQAGAQIDIPGAVSALAKVEQVPGGKEAQPRAVIPTPGPAAGQLVCYKTGPRSPWRCFRLPSIKVQGGGTKGLNP